VLTRVLVVIASLAVIGLIGGTVMVLGGGGTPPVASAAPCPKPDLAGGLTVTDVTVGTGACVQPESTVSAKYTGKLADGTVFDSTDKNGGKAIDFPLSGVIKGGQQGMLGMKVGGKRTLVIPPELGYGAQEQSGIPANSTLTFDIELTAVK
jgi:peptidylprolyl isomerase